MLAAIMLLCYCDYYLIGILLFLFTFNTYDNLGWVGVERGYIQGSEDT